MSAREYAGAVLRSWKILAAAAVLGALGGVLAFVVGGGQYRSEAVVVVGVDSLATPGDRLSGAGFVQSMMSTYTATILTPAVLEPVIEELDLDLTGEELRRLVDVDTESGNTLVGISAVADSPEDARELADAIVARFAVVVSENVSPPTAVSVAEPRPEQPPNSQSAPSTVSVTVLSPASLPTEPVGAPWWLAVVVGMLAGLVVGVGVALALAALDRRVRTPKDAERIASGPVLAEVSAAPGDVRRAARLLARAVRPSAGGTRVVLLAGVGAGSATADLAAATGEVLAAAGLRVAAVDAGFDEPALHAPLGLDDRPGLGDVLDGRADLSRVAAPVHGMPLLTVVPAGLAANGAEALLGRGYEAAIRELAGSADVVLILGGDLAASTDAIAAALTARAEAVLVVATGIEADLLDTAVAEVRDAGLDLRGIVLASGASDHARPAGTTRPTGTARPTGPAGPIDEVGEPDAAGSVNPAGSASAAGRRAAPAESGLVGTAGPVDA